MKTVIYLCNTYIATIEELQKTIENNYLGKAGMAFRKEMVALLKDGVLEDWLKEHDCEERASHLLRLKETNEASDSEIFKKVYHILLGKECTADLDSAFSQIAVLLKCEIDGNSVEIKNNRIKARAFKTKELKFVFKALEEIDSKMAFELVNANVKQMAESSLNWYAKDSEFSISFNLEKQNNKGVIALHYKSEKEDVVCEINLVNNTKEIFFDKSRRVKLYYLENQENTKEAVFWVLEPNAFMDCGIDPSGIDYCLRHYEGKVGKAEYILKKLNDLAKPKKYKFRFARENEIKTLITCQRSGDYPPVNNMYWYPMEDSKLTLECSKFTTFFNGKEKTQNPHDGFTFVAVLDEKK